jgi:hypothetical protein
MAAGTRTLANCVGAPSHLIAADQHDAIKLNVVDLKIISFPNLSSSSSSSSSSLPSESNTICPRVHLMAALDNGDLLLYEAFRFAPPPSHAPSSSPSSSSASSSLVQHSVSAVAAAVAAPLRFARVPIDCVTRPLTAHAQHSGMQTFYARADRCEQSSESHIND